MLSLDDGAMTNRMVEVEHGTDVADVRLVPLASGRVALVTGEDVSFFALSPCWSRRDGVPSRDRVSGSRDGRCATSSTTGWRA